MDLPSYTPDEVLIPGPSTLTLQRDVPAAEACEWILAWSQQGWIPVSRPEPLAAASDRGALLRFTLGAVGDVRMPPLAPPDAPA